MRQGCVWLHQDQVSANFLFRSIRNSSRALHQLGAAKRVPAAVTRTSAVHSATASDPVAAPLLQRAPKQRHDFRSRHGHRGRRAAGHARPCRRGRQQPDTQRSPAWQNRIVDPHLCPPDHVLVQERIGVDNPGRPDRCPSGGRSVVTYRSQHWRRSRRSSSPPGHKRARP
jgi:hypothetical protein